MDADERERRGEIQRTIKEEQAARALVGPTRLPVYLPYVYSFYTFEAKESKAEGSSPTHHSLRQRQAGKTLMKGTPVQQ